MKMAPQLGGTVNSRILALSVIPVIALCPLSLRGSEAAAAVPDASSSAASDGATSGQWTQLGQPSAGLNGLPDVVLSLPCPATNQIEQPTWYTWDLRATAFQSNGASFSGGSTGNSSKLSAAIARPKATVGLRTFLSLSFASYVLLEVGVVPWARARLRAGTKGGRMSLGGLYAGLSFLSGAALVAVLSTLLLMFIIFVLKISRADDPITIQQALASVSAARKLLTDIGETWGWIVTSVLIISVTVLTYLRGKTGGACLRHTWENEIARLRSERAAGNWPSVRPTWRMRRVAKRIKKLEAEFLLIPIGLVESESREIALRESRLLREEYEALDLSRRMNVEQTMERTVRPGLKNGPDGLLALFLSQRLLTFLPKSTRIIAVACLLLLVPSFIGIESRSANDKLDRSMTKLQLNMLVLRLQEVAKGIPGDLTNGPATYQCTEDDNSLLTNAVLHLENTLLADSFWVTALGAGREAIARSQVAPLAGVTPHEIKLVEWLRERFERSPTLRCNLRARSQNFNRAAEPAIVLGRQLFSDLLGEARSELGQVFDGIDPSIRRAFRTVGEIEGKQLFRKLLADGDPAGPDPTPNGPIDTLLETVKEAALSEISLPSASVAIGRFRLPVRATTVPRQIEAVKAEPVETTKVSWTKTALDAVKDAAGKAK